MTPLDKRDLYGGLHMPKQAAQQEQYHGWEPQEHDYDPEWDYKLRYDQMDHPMIQQANQRLQELAKRDDTPMNPERPGRVFPAELPENTVALYCSGTYQEPCILFNVNAHQGYEDQVNKTVDHEVRHAMQEADWVPKWPGQPYGPWANEDDAEGHSFSKQAAQQVMYHVAPSGARESIEQNGLTVQEPSERLWHESQDGVHLWDNDGDARDWIEWSNEQGHEWASPWDIWEVDANGLNVSPDPEMRNSFVTQNIPPDRIRRIT